MFWESKRLEDIDFLINWQELELEKILELLPGVWWAGEQGLCKVNNNKTEITIYEPSHDTSHLR